MAPDIALPPPPPRSNWFTKFGECLFAFVALVNLTFTFGQLVPGSFFRFIGSLFFLFEVGLSIPIALVFSLLWHQREKRGRVRSAAIHAWTLGLIRYWLAFIISLYGYAKILRTQFAPQFTRNDIPVGHLSGFQLTWTYFGHSYTFAVILALLQIGGSFLLLFRRTTLLGAVFLLPVMVNIVLINLFYNIDPGAFLNSVLFTLALGFFIYLRRKDLIALFLQKSSTLPPVRLGWFKYLLRLMAIGGSFCLLYSLVLKVDRSPIEGKWNVVMSVSNYDGKHMNWNGMMGKDTLFFALTRR